MDRYFKTEDGKRVNVIGHTLDILRDNPFTEIYIGCDSQNNKKHTKYATCIVYRYPNAGAHYIYRTDNFPKIKDLFTRLFKECEFSLDVANYLQKEINCGKLTTIELDYNNVKITKSTPLIQATRGWVESSGYKCNLKGGLMIATKVSDRVCRM